MAAASQSPPTSNPGPGRRPGHTRRAGSLVDLAEIRVEGGHGGRGAASFRREPYVPRGGPDGGDGGRGGSVILRADPQLSSLHQFLSRRAFRAEPGKAGAKARKEGESAADVVVPIPVGTLVTDSETGAVVADLDRPGAEVVAARGGAGGRGNIHFKSSVNQAPDYAEPGRPGQHRTLRLELKLIADAGLVGKPNAGKSSLLAAISAARPKVGAYPFTTLDPELGVVETPAGERTVVADIPGLIEGAAGGAGLGLQFLRHVERTRVMVYVIDGAAPDPLGDLDAVRAEVSAYSADLAARPSVVVVNKIDLPEGRAFRDGRRGSELVFVSALTGDGIPQLIERIHAAAMAAPRPAPAAVEDTLQARPRRGRRAVEPPVVLKRSWGYELRGPSVERLLEKVDFDSDRSFDWFQVQLDRQGITEALLEAGVEPGDTVRLGEMEFEFQP